MATLDDILSDGEDSHLLGIVEPDSVNLRLAQEALLKGREEYLYHHPENIDWYLASTKEKIT